VGYGRRWWLTRATSSTTKGDKANAAANASTPRRSRRRRSWECGAVRATRQGSLLRVLPGGLTSGSFLVTRRRGRPPALMGQDSGKSFKFGSREVKRAPFARQLWGTSTSACTRHTGNAHATSVSNDRARQARTAAEPWWRGRGPPGRRDRGGDRGNLRDLGEKAEGAPLTAVSPVPSSRKGPEHVLFPIDSRGCPIFDSWAVHRRPVNAHARRSRGGAGCKTGS